LKNSRALLVDNFTLKCKLGHRIEGGRTQTRLLLLDRISKVFKIKSNHFKCFLFYLKSGVRAEKRDEELYFISKTDASDQQQQQ
jgi:hypothetical protein